MTTDPDIWILITLDGTVSAYDTQHAALNAAIDETDPWIECVTINCGATGTETGPGARVTPEPAENAPQRVSRDFGRQTGAQRIHVPTSTGMTAWYRPWDDGDPT